MDHQRTVVAALIVGWSVISYALGSVGVIAPGNVVHAALIGSIIIAIADAVLFPHRLFFAEKIMYGIAAIIAMFWLTMTMARAADILDIGQIYKGTGHTVTGQTWDANGCPTSFFLDGQRFNGQCRLNSDGTITLTGLSPDGGVTYYGPPPSRGKIGWIELGGGLVIGWFGDYNGAQLSVSAEVDGMWVNTVVTGDSRPDVSAAFPGFSDSSGFRIPLPAIFGDGQPHSLHVYSLDDNNNRVEAWNSPFTIQYTVSHERPFGFFDGIFRCPDGGPTCFYGWAVSGTTRVLFAIDDRIIQGMSALPNNPRSDVQAAYPGVSPNSGFMYRLPGGVGPLLDGQVHQLRAYAVGADNKPWPLIASPRYIQCHYGPPTYDWSTCNEVGSMTALALGKADLLNWREKLAVADSGAGAVVYSWQAIDMHQCGTNPIYCAGNQIGWDYTELTRRDSAVDSMKALNEIHGYTFCGYFKAPYTTNPYYEYDPKAGLGEYYSIPAVDSCPSARNYGYALRYWACAYRDSAAYISTGWNPVDANTGEQGFTPGDSGFVCPPDPNVACRAAAAAHLADVKKWSDRAAAACAALAFVPRNRGGGPAGVIACQQGMAAIAEGVAESTPDCPSSTPTF